MIAVDPNVPHRFHTVEVPFIDVGNRRYLTREQLFNEPEPWLMDFVERFPDCFETSSYGDVLYFKPPPPANQEHGEG